MALAAFFKRLPATSSVLAQGIKLATANYATKTNYETLAVTVPKPHVYHVELNRPEKLNAMNYNMWIEIGKCFQELHSDPKCRVIVFSGSGKLFTSGLDVKDAMKFAQELGEIEEPARKGKFLYNRLREFQAGVSAIELCNKPVIAAIHSACIGGGVSLVTAADIRYCTKDAWFTVKEVVLGLAADVGAIQRLPKIVGSDSLSRELCYTGRNFDAKEAHGFGLVSKVFDDKDSLMKASLEVAEEIASRSPTAVQVLKTTYNYSRDHTVQEGLDQIALWNQLMLQSEDFVNATVAVATKQTDKVEFPDY